MRNLQGALQAVSGYVPPVQKLATTLPGSWVEEALQQTGVATIRRRRLPMVQVVWLVLGMALMRNRSIREVVNKLDLAYPAPEGGKQKHPSLAASATSQARGHLGAEPMKWLMQKTGSVWTEQAALATRWQGLSVLAMDGTLLHVWDSPENREHFGRASGGGEGEGGYPLARLVTVCSVRTHLTLDAAVGSYHDSEHALLRPLLEHLPENSVTIVDKNFHGVPFLWHVSRLGGERHFLLPAKKDTVGDIVETHGKNDFTIELSASVQSRKKYPEMPAKLRVRAVWFRHPKTGRQRWLLTSLMDRKAYPRLALVQLYKERWEIELGYDEFKTHMLDSATTLRSKTVQGVHQELWGCLLAHNLVRWMMFQVARAHKLSPLRLSFLTSLRLIADTWLSCAMCAPGTIPAKLQQLADDIALFLLPKRRKKRSYPRAVKFKPSKYPKKQDKNLHMGS